MRGLILLILLCLLWKPPTLAAATTEEHRERRPDLFHAETGFRVGRQRAPTPSDIPPPAILVDPLQAQELLATGALPVDVFGAAQSRFDELDGSWLVSEPRLSLPGALWLPEVGRGILQPVMQRYLTEALAMATGGDLEHPLLIYCVADCWMSWNAAQRIAMLGYRQVYWYRLGTDGWLDLGLPLSPVEPVPVTVD